MNTKLIVLFCYLCLAFPAGACDEVQAVYPESLDFSCYVMLESPRIESAYLDIEAGTEGVLHYQSGKLPSNLESTEKMYTFKARFFLNEEAKSASMAAYLGLFEYPFSLYLNGTEILRKGRNTAEYYNSSLRKASQVYLPPALLHYGAENDFVVEIYPSYETWGLDRIFIGTLDQVSQAVFLRNFFGVNLVQAACVLSLGTGLYFLVFFLISTGDKKKYLYFSGFSFLFCLTYFNVVIHHETMNEILMESISKAGMVLLATALIFFVIEFTKILKRRIKLQVLLLLSGLVLSLLVFLQNSKERLLLIFSQALNYYVMPVLILSFVLVFIYGIKARKAYFYPLLMAFVFVVGAVVHDAVYFMSSSLPYIWMLPYGFLALLVSIFIVLIAEQARVFQKTLQQASDLQVKQIEIEQLNKELLLQNDSFFRFVPTEFLDLLGKKSVMDIQLGDNSFRRLSVLFSDIRQYTGLSEEMLPQKSFEFINTYLLEMEKAIYKNKGFVDKYIGDAIMALFSFKDEAHDIRDTTVCELKSQSANASLAAALQMEMSLQDFNTYLERKSLPNIDIGIGVNTGAAILGTVGSFTRLDTTVIGDAVNIASRLESLTKMYKTRMLVSEYTKNALSDETAFALRHIDDVVVSGRLQAMKLYELLNPHSGLAEKRLDSMPKFEKGLALYKQQSFKKAEAVFQEICSKDADDSVAELYQFRCQSYNLDPPKDDWDGIFRPHK